MSLLRRRRASRPRREDPFRSLRGFLPELPRCLHRLHELHYYGYKKAASFIRFRLLKNTHKNRIFYRRTSPSVSGPTASSATLLSPLPAASLPSVWADSNATINTCSPISKGTPRKPAAPYGASPVPTTSPPTTTHRTPAPSLRIPAGRGKPLTVNSSSLGTPATSSLTLIAFSPSHPRCSPIFRSRPRCRSCTGGTTPGRGRRSRLPDTSTPKAETGTRRWRRSSRSIPAP